LVTGISLGSAIITATTVDGNKTATSNITVSPPLPGILSGTAVSSSTSIDLTLEGTADWAHWPGYDHKASGGSKISDISIVGVGPILSYTNDPRSFSWNDGIPSVSGSNFNGAYINNIENGFQFSVPADLTTRTLKVYVGGWLSGGTLTAQLSDGSAPNYVDILTTQPIASGQYNAVYILTYQAGGANKTLTVKWVQSSGAGNVTIQAATLSEAASTISPLLQRGISIPKNEPKVIADKNETSLSDKVLFTYPNPFSNEFILNYSGKENGKGQIMIYNSAMKPISTFCFEKNTITKNSSKGWSATYWSNI
jgi:hypothetical protein